MLSLLLLSSLLIAEDDLSAVIFLYDNSTNYIFEERVNVRSAPDLKSKKVGLALIGEEVKVIEKLDKTEELYGLKAPWYRVKWKGKECYIWGGLISNFAVKADFDRDGRDEILMSRATGAADYPNSFFNLHVHNLRLCRPGKLINNRPFDKAVMKCSELQLVENRGFTPELKLLQFYCGIGDGPGFYHNRDLYYYVEERFELLVKSKQEGHFDDRDFENIIYPIDEGGKENTIRVEKRITKKEIVWSGQDYNHLKEDFELDNHLEWAKEYHWDGKRFTLLQREKQ